tara:strand:+ start:80 stop:676 length:597 start_codon:yes stop_codon:yes gene_type:complete
MSEIKVNKISPATGTETTLGDSSDDFLLPSGAEIIAQSGSTITIASGATLANAGTATGFGGGKLGQVVVGEDTTATTITSTRPTYTDVGLSVAITPSATSSSVYVHFNMQAQVGSDESFEMQLMRDTTAIWTSNTDHHVFQYNVSDLRMWATVMYKDTGISTTSATTYKVQCATAGSDSVIFNMSGANTQIVAMEILA